MSNDRIPKVGMRSTLHEEPTQATHDEWTKNFYAKIAGSGYPSQPSTVLKKNGISDGAIPAYAFKWVVFDTYINKPVAAFILRAEAMAYIGDSMSYDIRESF